MKTNPIVALLFVAISSITATAQEFNCQVRIINAIQSGTKTIDQRVYKTLEGSLKDYIDGRKWTDDAFKNEERIECSINITVKEEISQTRIKADFTIQASRPVFNSSYRTVMLSFVDKDVEFEYQEGQPIDLNENAPANNISAVCGFHVFMMLGLDYDSFAPLGGSAYYQKAQALMNATPKSFGDKNWGPSPNDRQRSRYWLIETVLNPRAQPYRRAMYDYHRLGLDLMYDKPAEAKVTIADAIDKVGKVNRDLPNSVITQLFVDTKGLEVVQMFTGTAFPDKAKIADTMIRMDGSNAQRYSGLQ